MIEEQRHIEIGAKIVSRPHKFWKFREVDVKLQAILERQELWFASTISFNDPYDCVPVVDSTATLSEIRRHFRKIANFEYSNIPRSHRLQHIKKFEAANPLLKPGFAGSYKGNAYITEVLDKVISKTGVLSLGGEGHVVLMWSHYAASHKGVALAFNTDGHLFREAKPVIYSEFRPAIKFFHEQDTMIDQALFTKAEYWSYEKEWRVLSRNYIGARLFSPKDLPSIVFGARCSEEDQEKVRQWAKNGGLLPAYYQVKFDATTFGLRRVAA